MGNRASSQNCSKYVARESTRKVYDCLACRSANSHTPWARIFDGCSGCVKCPSWSSRYRGRSSQLEPFGTVSPINKLDRGVSYFFVAPLRQRAISQCMVRILFTIRSGEIYYGIDFPHGRSD